MLGRFIETQGERFGIRARLYESVSGKKEK